MRLAAGDCTGILVDAIIAGNPGAVAAVCGARRSPMGGVRQASQAGVCSGQGCKRDRIETQACEHRALSGPEWVKKNLGTD